jgi:hypothetical protein
MADKVLLENEWLSLIERDGWYIFAHESRCADGALVAIVPYITEDGEISKVLGRFENCPAHGDKDMPLCCITGGVDKGDTPIGAVLKELDEEGGFIAEEDDLIELGTMRPIASSDAIVHLYAIDCTDREEERRKESRGDGTKGEEGAYCDWVSLADAAECKSANMMACLMRLYSRTDIMPRME